MSKNTLPCGERKNRNLLKMPELSQIPINPTSPGSESPQAKPPGDAGAEAGTTGAQGEAKQVNPFKLPPEVAKIPAVQLVSVGAPPAIRVGPGEFYPDIEPVVDNIDKVLSSGLDVYRAQDDSLVLFNPLFISGEELTYLDGKGQLNQVVPDYGSVSGSQPQEIPDDKIGAYLDRGEQLQGKMQDLTNGESVNAAPQATGTPTPVPGPTPGQRSAVLNHQQQAIQAAGGPPTSGPVPGGGRLLNTLLRPPAQ